MDFQRHVDVTANTKTARPWKAILLLAWLPGVLYVLSRLLPCHPVDAYADWLPIDDAWALCLHAGFAQHLQFSRDIIFTYGPWVFWGAVITRPRSGSQCCHGWCYRLFLFGRAGGWRVFFINRVWMTWLWLMAFAAVATLPLGNGCGFLQRIPGI